MVFPAVMYTVMLPLHDTVIMSQSKASFISAGEVRTLQYILEYVTALTMKNKGNFRLWMKDQLRQVLYMKVYIELQCVHCPLGGILSP